MQMKYELPRVIVM